MLFQTIDSLSTEEKHQIIFVGEIEWEVNI